MKTGTFTETLYLNNPDVLAARIGNQTSRPAARHAA